MDILGSALTSPTTMSWTINRKISTSNHLQRTQEPDEETMGRDKQSEKSGTYQTYEEWEKPIKRSFQGKLKELFQRVSGSTDEVQPLLIARPKSKPVIPRDKLKMAGKRLRKALHQSIRYMAIGMENMSTMVYISANVPSSVYYSRNIYDSNIPSFY